MRRLAAVAACLLLGACSSTSSPGHPTTSRPSAPSTARASSTAAPQPSSPRTHHHPAPKRSKHRTSSAPPSSTPAPPSASPSHAPSTARPVPGHPTVVLNPGHNGGNATHPDEINRIVPAGFGQTKACDDTGTNTDAGYAEHAFNWSVANDVATVLRAHGVRVVFTRPNDTGAGPCVDQRAAIGNKPDVAAVVSIHADGADPAGHGFHVNQCARVPDGATAAVAHESDALGQHIHAALARSSGLVPSTYIGKDGYFYRTDLAGLNLARRPATFLELGNMRNAGDAALQSSASGRERIARAIAAGILSYLGR